MCYVSDLISLFLIFSALLTISIHHLVLERNPQPPPTYLQNPGFCKTKEQKILIRKRQLDIERRILLFQSYSVQRAFKSHGILDNFLHFSGKNYLKNQTEFFLN